MQDSDDQQVVTVTPIIDEVTAVALHAIASGRSGVPRSNVGKLQQALDRTLQAVDVGTRLILTEVSAGPFEDRTEVCLRSNRKD
jgi:hypothetical protein